MPGHNEAAVAWSTPGYSGAGVAWSTLGCAVAGLRGACRDIRRQGRVPVTHRDRGRRVPARASGSRYPPVVPGAAAPTAEHRPRGPPAGRVLGEHAGTAGLGGWSVPRPAPPCSGVPRLTEPEPQRCPGTPSWAGGFVFVAQEPTSPSTGGFYLLGLSTPTPPGFRDLLFGVRPPSPPRLSLGSRVGLISLLSQLNRSSRRAWEFSFPKGPDLAGFHPCLFSGCDRRC